MNIEKYINKVHNCDCLELLKELPDKCIDLVLTDLPYGINLKYDNYIDSESNWDNLFLNSIPEIKRISKMAILPCCRITKLKFIYDNFPPDWIICWYKGSPGHRSYIGFNDWEPHLVYGKNKEITMHDYFQSRTNEKMGNYGHPCPKPLHWAEWIISRATSKNDIVADFFLGSGTTAVACEKLGRRWIGCEISKKYCKIAESRIKAEQAQGKLNL